MLKLLLLVLLPVIVDGQSCEICGEGAVVTNPDAIFSFPGQPTVTCGVLESAGLDGLIPDINCPFLPLLIESICECTVGTREPSASPSSSSPPTPSLQPVPDLTPAPVSTGTPTFPSTTAPVPPPTTVPVSPPTTAPVPPPTTAPIPPVPLPTNAPGRIPCPNPSNGGCSICGNGMCIQNPTNRYFFSDGADLSCGSLQSYAFQGGLSWSQCAQVYISGLQEQCGCGDSLPEPDCDVDDEDTSDIRTSTMEIQFSGDFSEATSCEINLLQDTLRDSFNALNGITNPEFCDPDRSRIIRFSFKDAFGSSFGNRRLKQDQGPKLRRSSKVSVGIDWTCKNTCPKENLTGDDAIKRRKAKEMQPRFLDTPDPCQCPESGVDLRAPTSEEITAAFSASVRTLLSQGKLESVDDVGGVAEVEEVVCDGDTLVQEDDVMYNITGNRDQIIESATTLALEEGFVTAYNGLARGSCDQFFRTVQAFTITRFGENYDDEYGRRLQVEGPSLTSTFPVFGKVKFPCKKCPKGTPLVDNDANRRLATAFPNRAMQSSPADSSDYGEYTFDPTGAPVAEPPDDTCFCPVFPASFDAPTETELTIEFNRIITQVFQVPSVVSINNVTVSGSLKEIPCPEPNSGGCSICGFQVCVQNPANRFFFQDGFEVSCGTLESIAFQGGFEIDDCASIYLQGVESQCGCGATTFVEPTPPPTVSPGSVSCPQPGPQGCSPCGHQHCVQFVDNEFSPGVSCGQLQGRYFEGPFAYKECAFIYSDVFNICGCVG